MIYFVQLCLIVLIVSDCMVYPDPKLKKKYQKLNIQNWIYRKVASTNASRFEARLVYMHTQNDIFFN